VSALVDQAVQAAGLGEILAARAAGVLSDAHLALLRAADLLALGALADAVRVEDVGADVHIYTGEPPPAAGALIVLPPAGTELTGLELLREVAVARITGARAARVRVDWTCCGLELAQIALGFGADELVGRIANKRGLPIQEGERLGVGKKSLRELAQVVKRNELAGQVRRAGRIPRFVGPGGQPEEILQEHEEAT
jgi:hypothetical protein